MVWIKSSSSVWYYQHWNVPEQYLIVNLSQLQENHVLLAFYDTDVATFHPIAIISVSIHHSNPHSFLVFFLGVEWRQRVLYLLVCVSIYAATRLLAELSIKTGNGKTAGSVVR